MKVEQKQEDSKQTATNEEYIFKEKLADSQDYKESCRYVIDRGLGQGTFGRCIKVIKFNIENTKQSSQVEEEGKVSTMKIFEFEQSKTIEMRLIERKQKEEKGIIDDWEQEESQGEGYARQKVQNKTQREHNQQMSSFKNEKQIMNYLDQQYASNDGSDDQLMRYFVKIQKSWAEPYTPYSQKKRAFIVMEYCENGDLETFLSRIKENQHQLSLRQMLYLAKQIAVAVYLLHHFKIIHLDIKFKNVLLDQKFQVKLCDFGTSYKGQVESFSRNLYVGTKGYMAPQVYMCGLAKHSHHQRPTYCYEADIFSLGCLLYKLFFKSLPERQDRERGITKQCFQKIETCKNSDLNNRDQILLMNLIEFSLITSQTKRYRIAQLLQLFRCEMVEKSRDNPGDQYLKGLSDKDIKYLIQQNQLYFNAQEVSIIKESLAQKLKSKYNVTVTKVYHVEGLGFLFLFSSHKFQAILVDKGKVTQFLDIQKQIITTIQNHLFECLKNSKTKLNKVNIQVLNDQIDKNCGNLSSKDMRSKKAQAFLRFLFHHNHILKDYEEVRSNQEFNCHKQQVNWSVQRIKIPNNKTIILMLSNGVIQSFFSSEKTDNNFNTCVIIGHLRKSTYSPFIDTSRPPKLDVTVQQFLKGQKHFFESVQKAMSQKYIGNYVRYIRKHIYESFKGMKKELTEFNKEKGLNYRIRNY